MGVPIDGEAGAGRDVESLSEDETRSALLAKLAALPAEFQEDAP